MKFGTRILDGRSRPSSEALTAPCVLADVTEAAGLGQIDDMLSLVRACDEQPDLLSRLDPDALPAKTRRPSTGRRHCPIRR